MTKKLKKIIIVLVSLAIIAIVVQRIFPKKYWHATSRHTQNITYAKKLTAQQRKFIGEFLPKIYLADCKIWRQRQRLLKLYKRWLNKHHLTSSEKRWLEQLAKQYASFNVSPNIDFNKAAAWHTLLQRVDIVPAALALAQAILESGWGQSYFARAGYNYFSQHCHHKNCGFIPHDRPHGAHFEVERFSSQRASIEAYLHNLNTDIEYRQLRRTRWALRTHEKPLTSSTLVIGLSHYSIRGKAYIKSIEQVLRDFDLPRYDREMQHIC